MPVFHNEKDLAAYFEDIKLNHAREARTDPAERPKWERKWGDNFLEYAAEQVKKNA